MLGSVLEALLILMVNVYDEDAALTGRLPTKGGKPKPLLDSEPCGIAPGLRKRRAAARQAAVPTIEERRAGPAVRTYSLLQLRGFEPPVLFACPLFRGRSPRTFQRG